MKKKVSKHKLQLKVEKVRNLKDSETAGVQGGALLSPTTACFYLSMGCAPAPTGDCCVYSVQK